MMKKLVLALALAAPVLAGAALAPGVTYAGSENVLQYQTRTFIIENMTCATCPITVKMAMKRTKGVRSVDIDFEAKTATVVYDPSASTAEDIANASTRAGYPARVLER